METGIRVLEQIAIVLSLIYCMIVDVTDPIEFRKFIKRSFFTVIWIMALIFGKVVLGQ